MSVPDESKKQYRMWAGTLNNPKLTEVDTICATLKEAGVVKCIIGLEKAPTTGTEHLQFWMQFKNPRMFGGVARLIKGAHIEPSYASDVKNYEYCSKEKVLAQWGWPKKIRDPMEGKVPRQWQQEMLKRLEAEPDDREIVWVHGPPKSGKSSFIKSLAIQGKCLQVNGGVADIQYAVAEMVKAGNPPRCIVWYLTYEEGTTVSWRAVENVKDGMFFSPKYESGMCLYDNPHVWIFANFAPGAISVASDRIVVVETSMDIAEVLE